MSGAAQALALARLQVIDGTPEDKARVDAWDRLFAMLNALDSKTSALLRFNAIVVAALAYLVVVSGADPSRSPSLSSRRWASRSAMSACCPAWRAAAAPFR